jgi:hypothetical protein
VGTIDLVGGNCGGVCVPNATRCLSNGVETCGSNGQWSSPEACTNQACISGACTGVCMPTGTQCDGAVPQTCNASGQWVSGAVTSGTCGAVCTPGATECLADGDTPCPVEGSNSACAETCGQSGQWQTTVCGCGGTNSSSFQCGLCNGVSVCTVSNGGAPPTCVCP